MGFMFCYLCEGIGIEVFSVAFEVMSHEGEKALFPLGCSVVFMVKLISVLLLTLKMNNYGFNLKC